MNKSYCITVIIDSAMCLDWGCSGADSNAEWTLQEFCNYSSWGNIFPYVRRCYKSGEESVNILYNIPDV